MRARRNHCDPALDRPAHGVEPRGAAKGPAEARHGVQQRQRDRVRGAGWCRLVDQPCTAPPSTMKPAPSQGAPTPPIARSSSWPARLHAELPAGCLVLQSQFAALLLVVGASGGGLMASSPDRPGEGERRIDWWAPDQAGQQPAQLGDGERHQHAHGGHHDSPPSPVVGSVTWARVTARNASAVMARVMCRYQARYWRTW